MRWNVLTTLAVGAALGGCGAESSVGIVEPVAPTPLAVVSIDGDLLTGGGQLEHPTLGLFNFGFTARRDASGHVTGRFEYHYFGFASDTPAPISYKGDVTCFAVDPVNHRAWIGGVLTESNDPDPNPIFQVGHDAWFRMLDNGTGPELDRITLVGFEGGGGIPDSPTYCAAQIWPNTPTPNARTWPVISGNLTIH